MKSWQDFLIFVRGEDIINDDIGQTENYWPTGGGGSNCQDFALSKPLNSL
jgi:hypothetical protein